MPQHLVRRKQNWYVRVAVPRSLWNAVGRREVQRPTGTSDLKQAERRKHAIIAAIRDEIDAAASNDPGKPAWLQRIADELRENVRQGRMTEELASDIMADMRDKHRAALGTHEDAPFIPEHQQRRLAAAHRYATDLAYEPLSGLIEKYLAEREAKVTASTLHKKQVELEAFAKWMGDGAEVTDIDRQATGSYLTEVLQPSGRSPKTQKIVVGILSAFMNWAIRRGVYEKANPWAGLGEDIKGSRRGGARTERRAWTPEEIGKLDLMDRDDPMYPLAMIALYSGMRLNEIAHLRKADVDTDAGMFIVTEGKTDSSVRQVPIHPAISDLVAHWKDESNDEWLIEGLTEGGFDKRRGVAVGKRIGRWVRKNVSSDPGVVFHSLRNTFMHAAERAGVPESTVQLIVGHARPSLTYGLYSNNPGFDLLVAAMEKINYDSLPSGQGRSE